LGEAVTNAIGDFQVRAERPVRGPAKLALAKEHYAGQEVEVKLGGEDGPPFVDCEMSGALVLEGVVKDSVEDRPVAGAVVLVEMAYRSWPGQSDAAGRFRIEGLP